MSAFVRICSASEVPAAGEAAEFIVQGRAFCVANTDGTIAVLDGVCPHNGGPLGEGPIENRRIVCPWHAYEFDLVTGATEQDPDLKAEVFEAKVEGGELRVKL
jgi:nitrite reductase/ring-hydroxylating ferredoxin subunit